VSFVDVEAWGRQAETISQYMRKGRPLLVEGRLKQDTWEDKNTKQKQSKLKVVLEGFTFIDSRAPGEGGPGGGGSDAPRPARPASQQPAASTPAEPEGPGAEDDDVPF
jgi:single-strand DNA-binding protein